MRSHRFYTELSIQPDTVIELPSAVAHHCIQVLRYQPNDKLTLFNGDGNDYQCKVERIEKKRGWVRVIAVNIATTESPLKIHLYQGIARGDKMDFIIQKAVELGVAQITPLFSEYCNVKLSGNRLDKKLKHWQQVAVSACEQSARATIPPINPPQSLTNLNSTDQLSLILEPTANKKLSDYPIKNNVNLCIGPEGGFSEKDLELLQTRSWQAVNLGPRILRTETAGLAAISSIQTLFGDF